MTLPSGTVTFCFTDNALDVLERLVDKSMVTTRLAGDRIRYRLLETIRHYAWNKLVDAGDMATARDRHLAFTTRIVEAVDGGLRDERESTTADVLFTEHDNIRGALEWALAKDDHAGALRIVAKMWEFWFIVGRAREGLDWIDRVLSFVDGRADDFGELSELVVEANMGAACLGWEAFEPNARLRVHTEVAVAAARKRGTSDARWYDSWAFSIHANVVGEGFPVVALVEEGLRYARASGDRVALCMAVKVHGNRLATREGIDRDVLGTREAVEIARSSGSSSMFGGMLANHASLLTETGDLDAAVAQARDAVAAARRGPDVIVQMWALRCLGNAKGVRQDDDAHVPLLEAVEMADAGGLDTTVAYGEDDLAWLELDRGRPEAAREHFERAFAIFGERASHRPELLFFAGKCRQGIAETAHVRGDFDEARTIYLENLELARTSSELLWIQSVVHTSLGWLDQDVGNLDAARAHHLEAVTLAQTAAQDAIRDPQAKALALRGLAGLAMRTGDAKTCVRLSGAASVVFEPNARSGRVPVHRHRSALAEARASLDPGAFESAWADGVRLGLDQVLVGES